MQCAEICIEAGIPAAALQLLPGRGEMSAPRWWPIARGVGDVHRLHRGRRADQRSLPRVWRQVPLIAETGGQNAMIVDSTALPSRW